MSETVQTRKIIKVANQTYEKDVTVNMPTKFGLFQLASYTNQKTGDVHLALIKGELKGKRNVPLRIHSSCVTGDILGSLRCDCREQLHKSMKYIEKEGVGLVIYAFQEGRGIGLVNKLKAYYLQEQGLDTYEAHLALGFPEDMREYEFVADILEDLRIKSVGLLTNNPDKVKQLKGYGVNISKIIPHEVTPCKWNYKYLKTKRDVTGHKLTKIY
jgi:3,4-dihydroxy 2-butanone 4-phosphate synthase / GTP cyclohydrolase II